MAGQRASQVPVIVLGAAILTLGLLALLLLNLSISQGAYTLHDLRERSASLRDTSVALQQDITDRSSSRQLAAKAQELGMGPADSPAFLDPATGKVSGVAGAATHASEFTVVTGAQAVAPQAKPDDKAAAGARQAAGIGLGSGLVGGLVGLTAAP